MDESTLNKLGDMFNSAVTSLKDENTKLLETLKSENTQLLETSNKTLTEKISDIFKSVLGDDTEKNEDVPAPTAPIEATPEPEKKEVSMFHKILFGKDK